MDKYKFVLLNLYVAWWLTQLHRSHANIKVWIPTHLENSPSMPNLWGGDGECLNNWEIQFTQVTNCFDISQFIMVLPKMGDI